MSPPTFLARPILEVQGRIQDFSKGGGSIFGGGGVRRGSKFGSTVKKPIHSGPKRGGPDPHPTPRIRPCSLSMLAELRPVLYRDIFIKSPRGGGHLRFWTFSKANFGPFLTKDAKTFLYGV